MAKISFEIKKITASKVAGKDTSVITLVNEVTEDLGILGKNIKKVTYYLGAMKDVKANVGDKVELDIEEQFDVVVRPYTFDNEEGEEVTADCKWLHLKRA